MKILWRILVANGLIVIAVYVFVFLRPSFAPWDSVELRDFMARAGWILAVPLALEIIIYPIALRYRTGMGRLTQ
jgi:hypothetical protein